MKKIFPIIITSIALLFIAGCVNNNDTQKNELNKSTPLQEEISTESSSKNNNSIQSFPIFSYEGEKPEKFSHPEEKYVEKSLHWSDIANTKKEVFYNAQKNTTTITFPFSIQEDAEAVLDKIFSVKSTSKNNWIENFDALLYCL